MSAFKEFITKNRYLYGNVIMVFCFASCYAQNNKLLKEGNTNIDNAKLLKQVKSNICAELAKESTIQNMKNKGEIEVKTLMQNIIKEAEKRSNVVILEDDEVEQNNKIEDKKLAATDSDLSFMSAVKIIQEYITEKK